MSDYNTAPAASTSAALASPDAGRIAELERIVQLSIVENPDKQRATECIGELRASPDKWNVGLTLLHFGTSEVGKFFGLSLLKDFLVEVQCGTTDRLQERTTVRSALLSWVHEALRSSASQSSNGQPLFPRFMMNNCMSVLAHCVKNDYPEYWPEAFTELLQVGYQYETIGIDFIAGVVDELEVEVVMFNENRSREEVAHNTVVKDAMRESEVVGSLLSFFCGGIDYLLSSQQERRWEIAAKCLHCVAELVGWIDVNLVLNAALPTVGKVMTLFPELNQSPKGGALMVGTSLVRSAACQCLYELVKKGMDPVSKIQLVHSINLLALLNEMQSRYRELLSDVGNNIAIASAEEEALFKELQQWGMLLDALAMELLGCWTKYEDYLWSRRSNTDLVELLAAEAGKSELISAAPVVAMHLNAVLPLLLALFHHGMYGGTRPGTCRVSCSVLQTCNKLVAMLKHQKQRAAILAAAAQSCNGTSFLAEQYLDSLLMAVYEQSQYPAYFDFDAAAAEDDDVLDEVEAKNDVRKLFINCCRAHPARCLEMLTSVVTKLPQPLSQAEPTHLEAVLRLLYSYSECGPSNSQMFASGSFPDIIRALHNTDVASHPHPHVVLAFFEVSQRYLKFLDTPMLHDLARVLVGPRGVCSSQKLLSVRSAYFVLKVVEGMEGKSAPLLSIIGPDLSGVLVALAARECEKLQAVGVPPPAFQRPSGAAPQVASITEQSELYLCEAFALMTSSTSKDQQPLEVQQAMLQMLLSTQSAYLQHVLSLQQIDSEWELLCGFVSHRIAAISSLCKGFTLSSHAAYLPIFDAVAATVIATASSPAVRNNLVRQKLLVFLHRMVPAVGVKVAHYIMQALPALVQCAEKEDICETVQLVNQLMVEFQREIVEFVQQSYAPIINKFEYLIDVLEQLADGDEAGAEEAPHVKTERLQLYRGYLLFLQHLVLHNCADVLCRPMHSQLLPNIFNTVLMGLRGGVPIRRIDRNGYAVADMERSLSTQESVPVRKAAIIIVTGMINTWLRTPVGAEDPSLANVAQSFRDLFQQQLLPGILKSLVAATTLSESSCSVEAATAAGSHSGLDFIPLNVRDAAAQSVLVELAVLLRTAYHCSGFCGSTEQNLHFLQQMMLSPPVQWGHGLVSEVLNALAADSPLGTFKDHFKQLMRTLPATPSGR